MGRLTIILLFVSMGLKAQVDMNYVIGSSYTTIIEFKKEISAKLIQRRFEKAVINKDIEDHIITGLKYKYYIEIDENDENEYYYLFDRKRSFIKIYCLPRRIRKELSSKAFGVKKVGNRNIVTFESIKI